MPTTGLSAECSAELQGVRGKMMKMRGEADAANDRADQLTKTLQETEEKLNQIEAERNSLQRQTTNLGDQLFQLDGHLKDMNNKLAESDSNREILLNEVKSLNHRLNTMDAAEEMYKLQLTNEKERAAQFEIEASEYKRSVARLQMDNEKLDQHVEILRSDNMQLTQQLKEAEDRIAELTSSYNQIVIENRQMAGHRANSRHHEPRSLQAAPAPVAQQQEGQCLSQDVQQKERQLQHKTKDLDEALTLLSSREARIGKLENEVYVYQENYRILSDQLREVEQANIELKQQLTFGQSRGMASASDQLTDAREQNATLNDQLSEAEKKNASWEAKAAEMAAHTEQLEVQLQDQKAAYGDLYMQMNKTLKDIENSATNQGVCDF